MGTNKTKTELIEYFLGFSAVITGFYKFYLRGTGQVDSYYDTVNNIIGTEMFEGLLITFHNLDLKAKAEGDNSVLNEGILRDILGSEKFGAISRNIIKLWYLGTWYELPTSWREKFGNKEKDINFVVSPQAYNEGLLWPTLSVNPRAAKAPGYGTWAEAPYEPPKIYDIKDTNSLEDVKSVDSDILKSKPVDIGTKVLNKTKSN